MKMASSQTASHFDQFHTSASYIETLSCFIYKMNYRRCCSKVNFEGCPVQMWWSLVSPNF
jgi:hypothetical protein